MFSKINSLKYKIPIRYLNTKIKSNVKGTSETDNLKDDFETYDNVPSDKKKDFYEDYRDSIMIINSDRKLRYWYAFHTIPAIIFIPNLMNYLWVYQIFWSGTVAGIGMVCYDLYSDRKEKLALDLHILVRYI